MNLLVKIALICAASFTVPVSALAGTRVNVAIEKVNAIIARIEAGTPLTQKQKMFIFWEVPSVEYPYFFELNHKDFRVQKLKKLIEKSPLFSKEEKALFEESTLPTARECAFENLALHASVLPVLLPREDWAEEFKKYGPSWVEQKAIIDCLLEETQAYSETLENVSNKKRVEKARLLYVKAYLDTLKLDPPEDSEEMSKACAYFYEEVCPYLSVIQARELEILEKDRNFIFLIHRVNETARDCDEGSYLIEYKILEEIRERLEKRKAKEKS